MEASQITIRMLIVSLVVLIAAAISGMAKDDGVCGLTQDELFECKPAVAAGTEAPPPPTPACCTALGHANLKCFCAFKNNKYLPLLGINSTRAMELPSKCNPSISAHC